MRPIRLTLLLLLISCALYSQSPRAQLKELLQRSDRDTSWVKRVTGRSLGSFRNSGPLDSLFIMGELVLEESGKLGFEWGLFYGNYLKGRSVQRQNPDSSLYYDQLGLSLLSPDSLKLRNKLYRRLNVDYYRMGQNDPARYFAEKIVETSIALSDTVNLALAYSRLGICLNHDSDYVGAVSVLLKSVELAEQVNNPGTKGSALLNLGSTFDDLKDYEKALEYSLKAMDAMKADDELRGRPYVMSQVLANNIGRLLAKTGDFERGKSYLFAALKQPSTEGAFIERYPFYNLGNIHMTQGNMDSASYYLKKALKLAEEVNDEYVQSLSSHDLGRIFDGLQQYNQSGQFYQKAYEAAKDRNMLNNEFLNAAYRLYEINLARGMNGKALDYLKEWAVSRDSLYNIETTRQMARLEMEFNFESEKKSLIAASEKEQLVLEGELARRKTFQYAVLAIAFLVLLVAINFYRSNQRRKKTNEIISAKNSQLLASSQKIEQLSDFKEGLINMIAHDMKNSLNTILGLSKDAQPMDSKRSNLVRLAGSSILNLVSNMLDVQKFEETRVSIEKERFPIDQLIDSVHEQVLPLLQSKSMKLTILIERKASFRFDPELISRVLINLLTNAVKYAPHGSTITLRSKFDIGQDTGESLISVTDQGEGVDSQYLETIFEKFVQADARPLGFTGSSGLGLNFCKLAVEAHGGKIMATSPEGEGLTVSFSLPLETDDIDLIRNTALWQQASEVKPNAPVMEEEERQGLRKYAQELNKLKVYQLKQIKEVLDLLEKEQVQTAWQDDLWTAALHGNEERFRGLVDKVLA